MKNITSPTHTLKSSVISSHEMMGLSQSHLTPLSNQHSLHKDVAPAFMEMQSAAAQGGVDMQICSSFRSFDKQLSIWNRKWMGELPLYTIDDKTLRASELSDNEKIHAIMLWSALPGASRHHWGSDFDVYDRQSVITLKHQLALIPSEYEPTGPCGELAKWLSQNAADFGFYLPYAHYVGGVAKEPWHLSHKTTANIIQHQFAIDDLYAQLKQADILGKASILRLLPILVKQYTFNLGP